MTINESTGAGSRARVARVAGGATDNRIKSSLLDRLLAGETYALAFGGQGARWLGELEEIGRDSALEPELTALVNEAAAKLEPIAAQLLVVRPVGFDPVAWMLEDDLADPDAGEVSAAPPEQVLRSAAVSMPGVFLTQVAALRALRLQGLDPAAHAPVAMIGHSQGLLAAEAARTHGARDAELLALAQMIGAAATLVARRRGLIPVGERSPMVAVSNVDPEQLREVVAEVSQGVDAQAAVVVSIRNGRRRAVLSGTVTQLERVRRRCAEINAEQTRDRDAKRRGGAVFAPVFEDVDVEVAFHHPALTDTVDLVVGWANQCGVDADTAARLTRAILVDPVDWVGTVEAAVAAGAHWVLDLGPGDLLSRLTQGSLRGTGVGIVAASTRPGQRNLFTPGAAPEVAPAWSAFAPQPVRLPNGRIVVETAFTRLTGRSPILLAGMTPTTVDAKIVAAAANAGHWAELAGGGQVTEQIFADRVAELKRLLHPGRAVQFNSLFLDPYLWKLQLGGKRLVQRSRAAGAPFDGVVVTAGIPELEEAVALIGELTEIGIEHVAFKPGTVAQIRAVLRIADEVPDYPVITHIEGGRAGGHHSWEDLDDLLLETYAELRNRPNVIVCVGGGIGTPERATEYLTGEWSVAHGYPAMPLDGVLVGTAAMATLEATTAPEVKRLLVQTPGTPDWVAAGTATGGMASGRSQLGADIHEIDNSASRTGRLLDEVAGDADAVAARREEIIEALNRTAKPYFGDVAAMTYREWLRRYVELTVGLDRRRDFDCGTDLGDAITEATRSVWLDITWRDRFAEMMRRTESRLHPADRGEIPTLFADDEAFEDPAEALTALAEHYPDAAETVLHPADVSFFVALCKTPGKPVNFVPVVDRDVRRWWRSDSLWQAHDPRYSADQVCVIPGTVSVAGITRADEPVGELLDRFEQNTAFALMRDGVTPKAVDGRRRAEVTAGIIDIVLAAPDVAWAGRTTVNPIHRLGDRFEWTVDDKGAVHPPTGATLTPTQGPDTDHAYVELTVPLLGRDAVRIRMTVPTSVYNGGAPVVTEADAEEAMSALLAVAAGRTLPEVKSAGGIHVAHVNLAWTPDLIADHAGVTGAGLPPTLSTIGRTVPDVLVGACWPAVFAVLGAARTDDGASVIEGMLDLVHLDHRIELMHELPDSHAVLTVRAESGAVVDTDMGRVVEVRVTVGVMRDHGLDTPAVATLVERFAIRGRNGEGVLADPPRAAGTVSEQAQDTPRRRRRDVTVTAPRAMAAFAEVSGDHNPIHTSDSAAKLAGLGSPIVHGMWLSAAAQHVVSAVDPESALPARTLTAWTTRFLGMVRPGADIDVRVERIAVDRGGEIVEVSCRTGGDLVMTATGRLAAPKTVYAFPGQGIQTKGMGLDARSRSKAAKQVWDRADKHTRAALGFSILAVVRDNPTYLKARGVEYRHPQGVLHLTQFTQVAMATLGVAQVAELREAGAFVEGAMLAGHSVGEYNALAAVAGVLPLEAVLEVVFQRGSAMHELVPRDAQGRSDYRMAAIRPSQIGLPDAEVVDYVAAMAERAGEFLEVVNLNLRGAQYAIAGTVKGLEELEADIERRRAEFGGKRAFILVPGIDVPFHSTVLRKGVPEFRHKLDELLPQNLHPEVLAGRYIPNLVPRPFSLERDFIAEIAAYVPSEPLARVLADFEDWAARPAELCRVVLIELLAWQFASPVRWIETQDLLFGDVADGGLGVERFVEIGLAATPTVANLAANTLKLPQFATAKVEVLNIEREAGVVYSTDTDPAVVDEPEETVAEAVPAAASPAAAPVAAPAAAAGPRPDDIPFTAADATRVLIALWTKLRLDQIGPVDTIEGLCDGVSSRRNQLLVDLGSELSLGAIDGAADADMGALSVTVERLARTYKPFGSVLSDAVNDHLRKVFGPSGRRPAAVAERVKKVWQLGDGWAHHVTAEVSLGTREGASVRGGDLGGLVSGGLADGAAVDSAIDAAVQAVAARRGVSVALPAAGGGGGATVDAAALGEFTEQITGRDGVLATAARVVLEQLGLADEATAPEATEESLVDLVSAELGSDWPRLVAPVFDGRKAVLIDDRWATAREDLARLWLGNDADVADLPVDGYLGAGDAVAAQANWWRARAMSEARSVLAGAYERIAAAATTAEAGAWSSDIAVITGASKGSIAAAVAGRLLGGGATVVVTTSKLDDGRLGFYKRLYREHARHGAALWVVPANMASYQDIDALIDWVGNEQSDNAGGAKVLVKPAMTPTLLLPFAAPRVAGYLSDAGARAEMEMRVLLWSVERLVGGLSALGSDHDVDAKLHVLLPGSPNRGIFGGDGAYGESKAALDAVVAKWRVEKSWSQRVTLVHALIGWVRGTGLMGHNDPLVAAVEKAGVHTWSTPEIADELLKWCTSRARLITASGPQQIDLTGGLARAKLDLSALAKDAENESADGDRLPGDSDRLPGEGRDRTIPALPAPPTQTSALPVPEWGPVTADLRDMVVIVGAGELGPYGSARTRFEIEVSDRLSAAGVLELAWTTGLVTWENDPKPGWYDTETGDYVEEFELADRYHDAVVQRCGVRRYGDDGAMVDNSAPLLTSVFLDKDLTFVVHGEAEARAFHAADPEHTVVSPVPGSGDWRVIRKAGTEIRVPRKAKLSRTVGGQIPAGWDPTRWGISPDMAGSIDRVALWNIVCTVDAFLSSGFSPAELMSWVHPALVANTQGTGMGGMSSMRSLYIDNLLGEPRANDILQEALPNVALAHVVQSYVGSYGGMIHPVAACATAAVSVEEGVDKIRLGKAELVVAGGFDDLGIEGIVGFGDMSATADSAAMSAKGISDRYFSRANDRRRGGFVESQGGGTILLARGDVALEMGLPVLGVVAFAQSFADGVHTSIPAPGLGALGAGRGGAESRMAVELRKLGVTPDDIAVVSKHDTSTAANDPNESELHERLAAAIGRSAGAPLFVVSQKSLTGHAKGGAAAFQLIGLCQVLEQGVVPPNRSLDCVDDKMAEYPHLVWAREPLRFGDRFALKAGLVTSLGFGHVSGLLAIVHPQAFVAAIDPQRRADYQRRAEERRLTGRQRFAEAMCGGAPLYERPADRRLGGEGTSAKRIRQLEADILLSDGARLSADGVYSAAPEA
ncbi:type I polyketide synthase [Nocardia terpenica]|uniref:3-oxoacyl-ACP synthase n=1 Tax=Nocardia terpenica TaxID=455432 RepID=A0A164PDC8_9NOCA|nr:type I polyketide synthase [Nocardia terpenica]KZM75421.1 3-oxoacyl-ACP synthase [Nocardia terpenica]NQE85883.1 type I polyketide synthase [Nocardia terpenica]BBE00905.1 putative acyltransferase [Nocardia terpenica]